MLAPYEWFRTGNKTKKGLVLIGHGLNLRPAKMQALIRLLNENGHDCLRLSFTGHRDIPGEMLFVDSEIWKKDFREAVEEIKKEKEESGLPTHYLGFSLGGLLFGVCFEQLKLKTVFNKAVLLAPAFFLSKVSRAFLPLTQILNNCKIPSFNLADYRANSYTSGNAYYSLYLLNRELRSSWNSLQKNLKDFPLLVVGHEKDELVDFRPWQNFSSVILNAKDGRGQRHLIIDPESAGSDWEIIKNSILTHLDDA